MSNLWPTNRLVHFVHFIRIRAQFQTVLFSDASLLSFVGFFPPHMIKNQLHGQNFSFVWLLLAAGCFFIPWRTYLRLSATIPSLLQAWTYIKRHSPAERMSMTKVRGLPTVKALTTKSYPAPSPSPRLHDAPGKGVRRHSNRTCDTVTYF